MKYKHNNTKCELLISLLKDENGIFGRSVHKKLVKSILEGDFTTIFKLWRILEAIDNTNTAGLNYSGIETLRNSLRHLFKEEDCKKPNKK